jgi:hypothetical protein
MFQRSLMGVFDWIVTRALDLYRVTRNTASSLQVTNILAHPAVDYQTKYHWLTERVLVKITGKAKGFRRRLWKL